MLLLELGIDVITGLLTELLGSLALFLELMSLTCDRLISAENSLAKLIDHSSLLLGCFAESFKLFIGAMGRLLTIAWHHAVHLVYIRILLLLILRLLLGRLWCLNLLR